MKHPKIIHRIAQYVDMHIDEVMTIEQVASSMGYSASHMSALFKVGTGIPLQSYIRRRRMIYALLDDQQSMADVSMTYGYATQSGFNKAFKKIYGESPLRFRMRMLTSTPAGTVIMHYIPQTKENVMKTMIMNEEILDKSLLIADQMYNLTVNGQGKYSYDFWRRQFRAHPQLMLSAWSDDDMVGLMFGWVDQAAVTLAYDWVRDDDASQSIRRELLAAFESQVRQSGYTSIHLGVQDNEAFYQQQGYQGRLLIQSETVNVETLAAAAIGYPISYQGVYEDHVHQISLDVAADDPIRSSMEKQFPDCDTVMVYSKVV